MLCGLHFRLHEWLKRIRGIVIAIACPTQRWIQSCFPPACALAGRGLSALLNLLDRCDQEIDCAYEIRIALAAEASFLQVFRPVEPFLVRFWQKRSFWAIQNVNIGE